MKQDLKWQALAVCNLKSLVGKTIEWQAPASKENKPYYGKDKILSIDFIKNPRRPIICESLEGDELKYAFVDDLMNNEVMSYSDSYRVVHYKIIEE